MDVTDLAGSNKRNAAGQLISNASNREAGGQNKCILTLAGAVGVPDGHRSAPAVLRFPIDARQRDTRANLAHMTNSPTLSVISSLSGANSKRKDSIVPGTPADDDMRGGAPEMEMWPFKEALQSKRIVLVEDCSALIEGYPIQVWDELPTSAVVVPIASDSDDGAPSAVIVIGLSIRRPFDEEYESFLVSQVRTYSYSSTARPSSATCIRHCSREVV